MIGLIGGLVRLWLNIQTPSAIKNSSGTSCRSIASLLGIQLRLHSVQEIIYPLKPAYLGLKIERSEILERRVAAIEHLSP
jgi:hypothetical protein